MTFGCEILSNVALFVTFVGGIVFGCCGLAYVGHGLESIDQREARRLKREAADYRRMIWAIIASFGDSVTVTKLAMMDADERTLVRTDDHETGGVTFRIVPKRR